MQDGSGHMEGLASIDAYVVTIIVAYVAAIMLVGWWASRKVNNMDDFLVAGRKLPLWMATATLLATWFGAGSSMGVAATVYRDGVYGVVADPFGAALSLILAGLFYVTILRRMRLLTVTDIIERSYGRGAGVYASFWMLPVYIGWLGVQIMGVGKIVNILFGIDEVWASLIAAVIILIYTFAGGMWAVTLTDVVQVALIVFGLSIIAPLAVKSCGGLSTLLERIPASDISLLPPDRDYNSMVSYFGQWIVMGLGCIVGQDLIQRSLASKSPAIAGKSALLSGVGYLFLGLIPITIGFCGRYINWKIAPSLLTDGTLKDPDQLIPLMAVQVLPSSLLALFLSALLAAIMSSADSSLLAGSSLITNNIIRPHMPHLSDRRLLWLTRLFTVILTALSFFLALNVEKMFSLLVNSWASQLLVIFLPVTTAIYWKRVGKAAAWASMVTGPIVWIVYTLWEADFSIQYILTENIDDTLYRGSMYGFAAALLALAVTAWLRPRRPDEPELVLPPADNDKLPEQA